MFFLFDFYIILMFTLQIYTATLPLIKANGHGLKTATKKKDKDSNEEGDEVGR